MLTKGVHMKNYRYKVHRFKGIRSREVKFIFCPSILSKIIFKAEGVKPWEGQRSWVTFKACDCVSPCWIPLFVEMSRWSWWCCYSGSGRSTTVSCWCLSTAPQRHYSTDYNPAEKYTHSINVHTDVSCTSSCAYILEKYVRKNVEHFLSPPGRKICSRLNRQSQRQRWCETVHSCQWSWTEAACGNKFAQSSQLGDSLYIYMLLVCYSFKRHVCLHLYPGTLRVSIR